MDPIHAPPSHAVEAVEQGVEGVAVQAGAAVSPRTLWLRSPDCLLQVLCCVAFCGHPAWSFACLNKAFRGDEVLWGCIKDRCGPKGTTRLLACSRIGDLTRVRWLLDRGAAVNAAQARSGMTPLIAACYEGHLEVVRELLGRGADVNSALRDDGMTSLMWACVDGHLEIVRELLRHGASVNATLPGGMDSLTFACFYGRLEIVRELLGWGASVNNATYLMVASEKGHLEVVRELLGQGADVNAARTSDGWTSLMWACKSGHLEVARLLLAHHASKTAVDSNGKTAYQHTLADHAELRELVKP
jgi:ankyrin repeat protein